MLNNMLNKLVIPFDITAIAIKVIVENFYILSHVCKGTSFLNVSATFIDKTDPSDPYKHEKFWRKPLTTVATFGFNIENKVCINHCDNIGVIISIFYFAYLLHCMDYWNSWGFLPCLLKMDLFSHYFINLSITLLFLVISAINIIAALLLLLLWLMFLMLLLFILTLLLVIIIIKKYKNILGYTDKCHDAGFSFFISLHFILYLFIYFDYSCCYCCHYYCYCCYCCYCRYYRYELRCYYLRLI